MAYAAMNINDFGVSLIPQFLNGVCRHEQEGDKAVKLTKFLNGVCRHEHWQLQDPETDAVSKWRMPP